jgi:hypothetical protein
LLASFAQQGAFLASSTTGTLTVNGAPVTITISAPTVAFPANGQVTLTVSPTTAGGNINLSIDGNPATSQTLTNGIAIFTYSGLAAGIHSLTATYPAQGNLGSGAATGTLTVNATTTSTTITAPTVTYPATAPITVTTTSSVGTPPGNVTLLVDNVSLGSLALVNGSVSFSAAGLAAGSHALNASYAAQGNFAGSTATGTETVLGTPTSLTINAPSVAFPNPASVTITVASSSDTSGSTGTLAIDGGAAQSATLLGGAATFTLAGLSAGSHSLAGNFPAQGNFAASSNSATLNVTGAGTQVSISAPAVAFPANAQVPVTVSSSAGTPSGNVSLSVDSRAPTTQLLINGQAVFTVLSPSVGTHSLTATYPAQGNFSGASAATTLTVTAPQEIMTVSAPDVAFPSDALITVTLTSNAGVVGGTVTLSVDNAPAITQTLSNGQTTFTVKGLAVGTHAFVANYLGQGPFAPQSQSGTVTITGSPTSIAISAPQVTWPADGIVTLTVTSNSGTPPGPVSLSVDGGAAQTQQLGSTGTASFTARGLAAGTHSLSASYPGQGQFLPSSATGSLILAPANTTTTITVQASTSAKPVQFTVTVSSSVPNATPGGIVTLMVGTTQFQLALSNGIATFTTNLAAGSYTATATYPGQGNFAASSGQATFSVQGNDTVTAVTISPANPVFGQTVTATVTVSSGPGLGAPTGQIALSVDGQQVPTQALANGSTSFALTGLSVGSHVLVGTYSPADQTFLPSQGTATFLVAGLATSITIDAPNVSFASDEKVTVTVLSAGGTPTGNAALSLDGAADQTAPLQGGVALFDLGNSIPVGTHTVIASYPNQGNFATAPPARATFTVGGQPTTISATATDEPFGTPVPIIVTVTSGSGLAPVGRVSIRVDASIQQSAALSAIGTATFSVTGLPVGQHTVTATYTGSGAFLSSISAPVTFNVLGGIATTMQILAPDTPFPKDEIVTVTINPSSGPPPSGNLVYSVDGGVQTQVSFGSGVGTIRIAGLPVGQHTINVDYPTQAAWAESKGSATFRITRGCGCGNFNGTSWKVTPSVNSQFGGCYWFKNIDEHHKIEVYHDATNKVFKAVFSFPGLDQTNCPPAIYTVAEASFKCCGMTTFTFSSGGGGCNSLPSTVQIDTSGDCNCGQGTTGGGPTPSGCCGETLPTLFHATLIFTDACTSCFPPASILPPPPGSFGHVTVVLPLTFTPNFLPLLPALAIARIELDRGPLPNPSPGWVGKWTLPAGCRIPIQTATGFIFEDTIWIVLNRNPIVLSQFCWNTIWASGPNGDFVVTFDQGQSGDPNTCFPTLNLVTNEAFLFPGGPFASPAVFCTIGQGNITITSTA